jgi:hypothetical protein
MHLSGLNLVGWIFQVLLEFIFRLFTFNITYLKAFFLFTIKVKKVICYRNKINSRLEEKKISNDGIKVIKILEKEILSYKDLITK